MKKIRICSLICGLAIVFLAGCSGIRDHSVEDLAITEPHVVYFGNLTEVIIVPGQGKCRIVHEHFNRNHGHAFKVPYSIATVYSADRKFVISDKEAGNLAIRIDGKEYSLRKSNPVIHAQHGILWTTESFRQTPFPATSAWVYPLKVNLSALLTDADRKKIGTAALNL